MLVEIDVSEVHRTDLAVLVKSDTTGKKAWIPFSLIDDYCDDKDGRYTSIFISDDLAEKKELV